MEGRQAEHPHSTALLVSSVQSNPYPCLGAGGRDRTGNQPGLPRETLRTRSPTLPSAESAAMRGSPGICVCMCVWPPGVFLYVHVCVVSRHVCVCAHVLVVGGLLDRRSLRAVLWPSGPHLSCWAYPVGGGVLWEWRGALGPSCDLRGEVTPGSCQHPPGTGETLQPRLPAGVHSANE